MNFAETILRTTMFVTLCLVTSLTSFGQSPEMNLRTWTVLQETPELKIEMQTVDCERPEDDLDKKELVLKITNLSKVDLDLSWQTVYYYNGKCINCNSESVEYIAKMSIPAGTSVTGECNDRNRQLRHFVRFLNIENESVLTDFQIKNLKISPAATK